MVLSHKNAISPIIGIILLVGITVILGVVVFQFLSQYSQSQFEGTQNNELLDDIGIRIVSTTSDEIIIQTAFEELNISQVLLDGFECGENSGLVSGRPLRINVSSCAQSISTSRPRLIIETQDGIIERDVSSRDLGVSVMSSQSGTGSSFVPLQAEGGDDVFNITIDGVEYRIHAFTEVGESTFNVINPGTLGTIDVLVVGGGGGGGDSLGAGEIGGGGSGAEVIFETISISENSYDIGIGSGGLVGQNGQVSFFDSLIIAQGGGSGASNTQEAGVGGGGAGTTNLQFNAGGSSSGLIAAGGNGQLSDSTASRSSGGGGGGGLQGQEGLPGTFSNAGSGGNGGDGTYYGNIFGESFGEDGWFAGGGGGSTAQIPGNRFGAGGLGGGGNGGERGISAHSAQVNTGGGGGGTPREGVGGNGGSGIVLIRYPLELPN